MQSEMVQSTIGRSREKPHVRLRQFLRIVASFRNVVGDIHDLFIQSNETNLGKDSIAANRRRETARKNWWLDGGGLGG